MIPEHPALLRVALVTGCLRLGGSTTFLINFAGELVRRNIPVEVLSFEQENPLATDFQRLKVPVLRLDDHRMIYEDRLETLLRRLKEFQPTVVIANLGPAAFEVLRYMPSGVFRVGVGHSSDEPIYHMMAHYVPHMDVLVVVSKDMKQRAVSMREFSNLPVHYLAHGVPMPPEAGFAARNFTAPLRILYLGRLICAAKRVHLFPQIFADLKSSGIPFHWTIAGDGDQKASLEKVMQDSPAQTVSFLGQINYAEVPEILRAHEVCLLASDYEGFGLSVLEAMGSGLVPVVSDLPSTSEIVDETTGILVDVNDVAGYARGIIHLHEHRDELAAKSAAARARVQKEFSVAAMTDRWLSIFPQNAAVIGEWPARWNIRAPQTAPHPIYFSPPLRALRRLAAKFRQ